jgi:hypothetical protein
MFFFIHDDILEKIPKEVNKIYCQNLPSIYASGSQGLFLEKIAPVREASAKTFDYKEGARQIKNKNMHFLPVRSS